MNLFKDKTVLYVYWLRAPMLGNCIVYVGAAHNPVARWRHAQKRYSMVLKLTYSKPYKDFTAAKARETAEISKHWLTVFNLSRKSCVPKNYDTAVVRMSASAKLRGVSQAAHDAARAANTGSKPDKVGLVRLRAALKGVPHLKARGAKFTPEHCERIGDGNRSRVWTEESRAKVGTNKNIRESTKPWNEYQHQRSLLRLAEAEDAERSTVKTRRELAKARSAADAALSAYEARKPDRKSERELLRSGYGHPWRIKDLDPATQEMIG